MILQAESRHKDQIVLLWNKAFGDSLEDINKCIGTLLKYFVIYEDEGIIKGMLAVLPVTKGNKKGGYIYAVATHPDYRGQGICNCLIQSIKENQMYDFLVLVPQNEGLFNFYDKMDFAKVQLLVKGELEVKKTDSSNVMLKKLNVDEYETLRNGLFGNKIIKWDIEMLSFAKFMYNGQFYEIKDEEKTGFAFLYKENETVYIKELITKNPRETANYIGRELGAKNVKFSYPDENGKPTYMVYPKTFSKDYFGIYFD